MVFVGRVLGFGGVDVDVEAELCYFVGYEVFDEVGVVWDGECECHGDFLVGFDCAVVVVPCEVDGVGCWRGDVLALRVCEGPVCG